MKKVISIFFICIYLISFTEAKEILKFSDFIEHFKEHKSLNNKTTLYSFIVLHYLSGTKKDKDYQEDMKLPFKTHDLSCYNLTIQDLPKIFEFNFSDINIFEKKNQNFYYFLNFSEGKSFSFYPPPKFI